MTAQATAEAAASVTYALVEVGQLKLGVDTRCVVQAIPRPAHMTSVHRVQGALDGVFSLRGQVVPVVNLQRWRVPDAVASTPAQVLVLRSGDKVIGLAVDAVRGLLKVPTAEVHRVHHDDDASEFFHSVAMAEDKTTLVSLLDPERLMAQVRAWSSSVPGDESGPRAGTAATAMNGADPLQNMTGSYAVVRVGASLVGFLAGVVGEILAMPRLQTLFGRESRFMGMASWRGRDVPVTDIRQTVGLPEGAASESPWLMVLMSEGRCIGMPVDEIKEVRAFPVNAVQPGTTDAGAQANFYQGTVVNETGERIFLLDGTALINNCSLSALSQRDTVSGRTQQGGRDRSGAHVVFRAGQAWAAPMAPMVAIAPFPASFHRSQHDCPYFLGTFEWRGQALALLDLRQAHGQAATSLNASTRVIVIQVEAQLAGLVVEEVMALIPAHVGEHARFSMGRDVTVQMVTVGEGEAQKSYQVMDFAALTFFNPETGSPGSR